MAAKLKGLSKKDVVSQARASRHEYYDDNWEEIYAPVEEARIAWHAARTAESPDSDDLKAKFDLETQLWDEWFNENYPGKQKDAAAVRTRYKKKSKVNARAKISVTDRETLDARVDDSYKKVEWADWLDDGCLVQTKKGSIGVIVTNKDSQGYRTADRAVMYGGSVQVMIDGVLRWHRKINLRPLDD